MAEGTGALGNPAKGSNHGTHEQVPLFKLIAMQPLPFVATLASNSTIGGNQMMIGESYQLLRLLQVPKVTMQVLHGGTGAGETPLEVSIPKDYRAPFQVQPNDIDMPDEMSIRDVIKFMPKLVKVAKVDSKQGTPRRTAVQIKVGDTLNVLGVSAPRVTKSGVRTFLRLQKKHSEFSLSSDYKGKFRPLAVEYSIAEIVDKFSLPQKIFIVKPEEHSDTLLDIIGSSMEKGGTESFMAKRERVDEFVIGSDTEGQNAIVIHADAQLKFYPPQDVVILNEQNQNTGRDLFVDHVIHKENEAFVLCKPWEQIFRDTPPCSSAPPLQSRSTTSDASTTQETAFGYWTYVKEDRDDDSGSDCNSYEKIPFALLDDLEISDDTTSIGSHSSGYLKPSIGLFQSDDELSRNDEDNQCSDSDSDSGSDGYERIGNPESKEEISASGTSGMYEVNPRQIEPKYGERTSVISESSRNNDDDQCSDSGSDGYERIGNPLSEEASVSGVVGKSSTEVKRRRTDQKYGQPERITSVITGSEIDDLCSSLDGITSDINSPRQSAIVKKSKPPPNVKPKLPVRTSSLHRNQLCCDGEEIKEPSKDGDSGDATDGVVDAYGYAKRISSLTNEEHTLLEAHIMNHKTDDDKKEDQSCPPRTRMPISKGDLSNCTVDEIVDLLDQIRIDKEVQEKFRENMVDGALLCELDGRTLRDQFELSSFHAIEITRFVNGWRPKLGN